MLDLGPRYELQARSNSNSPRTRIPFVALTLAMMVGMFFYMQHEQAECRDAGGTWIREHRHSHCSVDINESSQEQFAFNSLTQLPVLR
jgi:hypothetical protein